MVKSLGAIVAKLGVQHCGNQQQKSKLVRLPFSLFLMTALQYSPHQDTGFKTGVQNIQREMFPSLKKIYELIDNLFIKELLALYSQDVTFIVGSF